MIDAYALHQMLPSSMRDNENSTNIKIALQVYADVKNDMDKKIYDINRLLDIEYQTGYGLDFIGGMYVVYRLQAEDDYSYRNRILETIVKRKAPTTINVIQEAIDSITGGGTLIIRNNHNGRPCNVYLTGSAKEEYITTAIGIVKNMIGAGILVLVPMSSLGIWGDLANQFSSWDSINNPDNIW